MGHKETVKVQVLSMQNRMDGVGFTDTVNDYGCA
jgi:hypothetical protein